MRDLIGSIVNIFRWTGKILTAFRTWTLNIGFLVLLLFILITLSTRSTTQVAQISTNGILLLSLSGDIVEEKQEIDPFSAVLNENFGLNSPPKETLLQDILDVIRQAAKDDKVVSILLDLSNLGSVGLNQLQQIGEALTRFKKSEKLILAAEDFYPQKSYYLASYADEIYLNPMGGVDLHGIGNYRLYFKDAIEKLKVSYNVFRVGNFKSAMEPIMRNSMSKEAKQQSISWLTPLWDTICSDIIRERNLEKDAIKTYTENIPSELATAGGDTARLALDSGLVDGLKTREELRKHLIGISGSDGNGSFQRIEFNTYLSNISRSYTPPATNTPGVGIIVAQGPILNGKQPVGAIGGDSLADMIRSARNDTTIKALVLRVISGGGSVFASEVIRQEILEFKKTGKPIVVSMGSMAASGGYWIAADADEIWASPATLTGSIGIFAAIPTFEESLSAIGVYNDGVGTTSLASAMNLTRPISPLLKETIAITLRNGYDRFLNIVAEGRSMGEEQLAQVVEGRVFDGQTAMELGLVDKLGGLEDAIAAAASLADLDQHQARYIKKPMSVKDEIMQLFSTTIGELAVFMSIPQPLLMGIQTLVQPVRELLLFNDPKGLYAHCMIHDLSW